MPPKNGGQAAGYSHLTNPAKDAGQVIGYSHSTEKLLAIPLGYQPKNFWPGTRKTVAKWLVISNPKAIAKCLVIV
jgi:hypothetical protein